MTGPVRVGIVLGSDSDLEVMLEAVKVLDALEVGKLTLGVAFSGVSPREIAAGLAVSLNGGAR